MTAPDSSQPTKGRRPRFQFSLRGLMVLFLGVAVGLGWARLCGRYGEGILAACTVWIVLGSMAQVRDLWRTFAYQLVQETCATEEDAMREAEEILGFVARRSGGGR